MATLTDEHRTFLRENAYPATVTTLREDGSPHSTIVWIDEREREVWFNTAQGRATDRHVRNDPRVAVMVVDPSDQFTWVAVSGTASLQEEGANEHINELSHKYSGNDYPPLADGEVREIVRIRVDKVDSAGFGG